MSVKFTYDAVSDFAGMFPVGVQLPADSRSTTYRCEDSLVTIPDSDSRELLRCARAGEPLAEGERLRRHRARHGVGFTCTWKIAERDA